MATAIQISNKIGNASARIEEILDELNEFLENEIDDSFGHKLLDGTPLSSYLCVLIDEIRQLNTNIDEKFLTHQLRIQGDE